MEELGYSEAAAELSGEEPGQFKREPDFYSKKGGTSGKKGRLYNVAKRERGKTCL